MPWPGSAVGDRAPVATECPRRADQPYARVGLDAVPLPALRIGRVRVACGLDLIGVRVEVFGQFEGAGDAAGLGQQPMSQGSPREVFDR